MRGVKNLHHYNHPHNWCGFISHQHPSCQVNLISEATKKIDFKDLSEAQNDIKQVHSSVEYLYFER